LRIFACETQPVVVEGLIRIFSGCSDVVLAGHASDLEVAVRSLQSDPPDLAIIGQPPAMKSVLPLLSRVRDGGINCPVVLWVTELSDMDSFRALQMGARGVISRTQPVSVMLDCFRAVAKGVVWLETSARPHAASSRRNSALRITPREREIMEYVCRGMKNREIAAALSITPGTVKVHLMHIFEKTGVKDRFQLALQGAQILGSLNSDAATVVTAAGAGQQ
jgi:two-component system nitrate/nitrite response regulator NarL